MPPACAHCGRPATGTRRLRLKAPAPYHGPDLVASLAGLSDDDQRHWHNLRQMFAAGKGILELPACRWHRWIVPFFTMGVKTLTDHRVTLWGLSDEFVRGMKSRGWVDV
jgi:hypothetical protein